ncbi:MAG TPA: DUF2127 domain-containing protein [Rhodanobacteraceae bacterium]
MAYLVGIALKGMDGLIEIVGGALLLLTSRPAIVRLVATLTRPELTENPHAFVATHALHMATSLSPGTQQFAGTYLLIHGAIKVTLVAGLVRGWRGAYPMALVLLAAFIGYQFFRLARFHSPLLAIFTAIDIVIVLLIAWEWRRTVRAR